MRFLIYEELMSFRVGGAARQLPTRKIAHWVGLGFDVGLVLGLGAIFLGGNCPRTLKTMDKKIKNRTRSLNRTSGTVQNKFY